MTDSRPYQVTVSSGALRSTDPSAVSFPHRWTAEGVTVEGAFTGAHLLHLAAAGCVLNDAHREAAGVGVELAGVRVTAWGDFDTDTWRSTGVEYVVELRSDSPADRLERLLAVVDEVAEIPRAIRSGATVRRVDYPPA